MDATTLRTLSRRFWQALLPEIALMLLLLLATSVLAWRWALHYQAMLASQQRWQWLVQATANAKQDERLYANWIQAHAASIQRWQASAWLTQHSRVHWHSTWSAIANKHQLPDAHYQFSPPQPCQPADWLNSTPCPLTGGMQLAVSRMRVALTVPHEAAILPWLATMQHYYLGAHVLRSCDWAANATHDAVNVECEWQWFYLPVTLPGVNAAPLAPLPTTEHLTKPHPSPPLLSEPTTQMAMAIAPMPQMPPALTSPAFSHEQRAQ